MLSKQAKDMLASLEARLAAMQPRPHQDSPPDYAREVLKVQWTLKQQEIAQALLAPPWKVLVKASHNVGKSFGAAGLINWFYDSFDPSATITTAPTALHVRDVLWREVRLQRGNRGGWSGRRACELRSSPDHYAIGYTTDSGEAFAGRHQERMLFIFDEGTGIDPFYWEIVKSMFQPGGKHHWLVIGNPTDTSSQMYAEDVGGEGWTVIEMSALDHPNVVAQLAGQPAPYPGAVSLLQVDEWVRDWCTPLGDDKPESTDIEWRPGRGQWFRPGPLFESRALGRWPKAGTFGVWSDALFAVAEANLAGPGLWDVPEIGCDPARFGDDFTAIHSRCGPTSLAHERHNGWDTSQTAGRLKQLCVLWAAWTNDRRQPNMPTVKPTDIVVKVDADGLGAGVIDQRGDYSFLPVSAALAARHPDDYPNLRSELWFAAAALAKSGRMGLARLDPATRRLLRRQALAPVWKIDGQGRCVVEPKADTKKRLLASPDDMDALNLAFWPLAAFTRPEAIPNPQPNTRPREGGGQARGTMGRGRR